MALRIVMLFALFLFTHGCAPILEESLGLKYVPPVVPDDVPSRFMPEPNSRLERWLDEGKIHLNRKEPYLHAHRVGGEAAIHDSRHPIQRSDDYFNAAPDVLLRSQCVTFQLSNCWRCISSSKSLRQRMLPTIKTGMKNGNNGMPRPSVERINVAIVGCSSAS